LTVVDTMPLACYCQSYSRWREAEEALARIADRDENMRGLVIKSSDGDVRRNPLVKISSDASNDMLKFASEFGLSPVARSRLAAGVHGQPSFGKFDGLIGGA
jgi:P27 family predicted phage terminase small subunit